MAQNDALADARRYEIMVILHPDLGEDAIKKRLDELRKQITSFPGEIFHEELWGLRDLKYSIKKQVRGYYAVLDFVADPSKIKDFNHALGLETDILRHMITVLPPTYTPVNYEEEAAKAREEEEARNPKPKREERKPAPSVRRAPKKIDESGETKLKKLIDHPDDLNF